MPFFPSSRLGTGYLEDLPDARDVRFDKASFARMSRLADDGAPRSARTLEGLAPVQNQGATSSCVAHAVRTAVVIREKLAGVFPVVEPSRLQLYSIARYQHGGHRSDSGTYIRDCIRALAKSGVCDEREYPFSEFSLKVNRIPPARLLVKGHMRSGGRYARLETLDRNLIGEIKNAIDLGLPVVFGTLVDQRFVGVSDASVVQLPLGKIIGGHAMCVVGYDDDRGDAQSRGAFRVQNSWGTGWGDGGYCWMSYRYLVASFTRDLWAIDGWKNIQRATEDA